MTPAQIKICGVTNLRDARACTELGASMIGFNFYPRSPRYIEPKAARQIIAVIPAPSGAVGVFVDASAEEVRDVAKLTGIQCVQLHGTTSPEVCSELAREFRVIRALSTNAQFRPEDVSLFGDCDVLLDAHHPYLHGGTGRTCDWLSARATRSFARFLILSGGLNAQNVANAIATVAPHAVDVCSSVESAPGVKDLHTLENFISAVRMADSSTGVCSFP
jgi:phosphoribosylanthranilate isomerase